MKRPKTKVKNDIDTKVKAYFEGEAKLRSKLGLTKRVVIRFPKRPQEKPSLFARFLIALLEGQGAMLDTEYAVKREQ